MKKTNNVPSLERDKEHEDLMNDDIYNDEQEKEISYEGVNLIKQHPKLNNIPMSQDPELNITDPKTYPERLSLILNKGKGMELKILTLNKELLDIKHNKDIIENTTFVNVCIEKIELEIKGEKKLKDKFTNKESRDAETKKRLNENSDYKTYLKSEYEINQEINDNKVDLNYFDKEIKAINSMIKMFEIRLI